MATRVNALIAAAGGLLLVMGALLPWSGTVDGLSGGLGWPVLIAGLGLALTGLRWATGRLRADQRLVAYGGAWLTLLVAGIFIALGFISSADVGLGLLVAFLGLATASMGVVLQTRHVEPARARERTG